MDIKEEITRLTDTELSEYLTSSQKRAIYEEMQAYYTTLDFEYHIEDMYGEYGEDEDEEFINIFKSYIKDMVEYFFERGGMDCNNNYNSQIENIIESWENDVREEFEELNK